MIGICEKNNNYQMKNPTVRAIAMPLPNPTDTIGLILSLTIFVALLICWLISSPLMH